MPTLPISFTQYLIDILVYVCHAEAIETYMNIMHANMIECHAGPHTQPHVNYLLENEQTRADT